MTFDLKKATSQIGRQIAGESPPEPTDSSSSSGFVTMEQYPDGRVSFSSEELDRFSAALNEVTNSPDDVSNRFFSSLLYDVLQVLVTLWVIILSYLWSYMWRQHNKKFVFCVCFIAPAVFTFGFMLSGFLTTLVVCGRFYSIFMDFKEKLTFRTNGHSRRGSMLDRRNRSGSSTSVVSVISEEYFVAPPLCRRHSLSTNSLPSRPPSEALRHTLHGAPAFALALASGSGYSPASAPGSASASSPVSAPTSAPSFAAEPTPVPAPALAHVSSSDSDN